jgi:hypothetical protein
LLSTLALTSNASTITTNYPCPPMPLGTYRYGNTVEDNSGNKWYVYFLGSSEPNFTISGPVNWSANMAEPSADLTLLACNGMDAVTRYHSLPFSLELGITNASNCTFTGAPGFSCTCSSPACTPTLKMPH